MQAIHGLDFTAGQGLEQLHRRPGPAAGKGTPEAGHFGAVGGIGQIGGPTGGGQTTDLPPAHGVGLAAGEGKRPAPGLPIWPVARCRWISAALLSLPWTDWLRPWQ